MAEQSDQQLGYEDLSQRWVRAYPDPLMGMAYPGAVALAALLAMSALHAGEVGLSAIPYGSPYAVLLWLSLRAARMGAYVNRDGVRVRRFWRPKVDLAWESVEGFEVARRKRNGAEVDQVRLLANGTALWLPLAIRDVRTKRGLQLDVGDIAHHLNRVQQERTEGSGRQPISAPAGPDDDRRHHPVGVQHDSGGRRRVARVLVSSLLPGLVLLGWYTGWIDPWPTAADDSACEDFERLTDSYTRPPAPGSAPPLHPLATSTQVPFDQDLRRLLLEEPSPAGLTHTGDHVADIDRHAQGQSNPRARELAAEHRFVRQVGREWADPQRNAISHTIVQLASQHDAEAFMVAVGEYTCRFAEHVRIVDLSSSADPAVAFRIRHQGGVIAEQITWTQGGRRHTLTIFDVEGRPDSDLAEMLARRAAEADDGTLRPASQ